MSEMTPEQKIQLIMLIVMTIISGIVFVVIVVLGLYIISIIKKSTNSIRKIKQNDKFMLCVILFLALTFGTLFLDSFLNLFEKLKILPPLTKFTIFVTFTSPYFFMIACTLNARNWA
jgi:heme/copper-type cytochrome/quinol oxidase subunit 2